MDIGAEAETVGYDAERTYNLPFRVASFDFGRSHEIAQLQVADRRRRCVGIRKVCSDTGRRWRVLAPSHRRRTGKAFGWPDLAAAARHSAQASATAERDGRPTARYRRVNEETQAEEIAYAAPDILHARHARPCEPGRRDEHLLSQASGWASTRARTTTRYRLGERRGARKTIAGHRTSVRSKRSFIFGGMIT